MRRTIISLIALAVTSLVHAVDTKGPLPKVPENWKVEVIKEAPEVRFCSVLCYAPDGRLFVGEDPMDMPGPSNKPIDRVLCIHPDGRITVFAEELYSVFGIQYLDGKVYIHHCPKLSVFRDDNGVGKDRVDLIDSTNPEPWGGTNLNDHIPANFRLAMDGYFYMAVGDKGIFGAVSNVDKRKAEIWGGGLLRFRPDGTDMEVYCTGTRNHLDLSMNAEDEMFTYDNTDDGHGWWTRFTHMVDSGFYGYPYDYRPHASDIDGVAKFKAGKGQQPTFGYTLWRMEEYGGGSPCGATGYNEDALPEEYRGNLFHCEWGKSEVDRFIVERDGGSFKVVKREPFLTRAEKSGELRPLGITTLPDGTGFAVADWRYGGWKNKDTVAGRVLKFYYTGKSQATPKPEWYVPAAMGQKFNATTQELVDALKHPAQSVRLVASRRAGERGAEAAPLLVALIKDSKAPEYARWHAIWTLDKIDSGKAGRDTILALAKDDNTPMSVRLQCVRQLGTRAAKEATSTIISLLKHQDAAMRFRAATALGRIGDIAALQPLIDNLAEKDMFVHYATFTALNRIAVKNPSAWDILVADLNSGAPEIRDGCAYAMRETYVEGLANALAKQVSGTGTSPEARATAIKALAQIARQPKAWTGKWWGTQPVAGFRPAREVDWAGTPAAVAAIAAGLKDSSPIVKTAALEALQISPDASAADTLAGIFKSETDTATRKLALRALAASKPEAAGDFAIAILKDPAKNADFLGDALYIAKKIGTPAMAEAIAGLAGADVSQDMLLATIDVLEKMKDPKAVPVLVKRLSHEESKVAEASAKALGQIKNDESINALIAALKDKRASVRRSAAQALEKLKPPAAVEPLLACVKDNDMKHQTMLALASIPDIRALDVYLEGVAARDNTLRDRSKNAIKDLHEKALPLIEKRLDSDPLPAQVISELQQVLKPVLKNGEGAKLMSFDTKSLAPEAFATYARAHKGDADNGRKIFFAEGGVGCAKCHKIDNDGGEVGPALTGVGSKYDREKLMESVLFPSKVILDGYQQSMVRTNDGQVLTGLIRAETDSELTVIDVNGQKTEVKKANIKVRKQSETSLMPEGLQAGLKPEEFADLIAFLESLKETKK